METESEEEVTLVVNLENVEEIEDIADIQILELDSENPYIQVGGMVFKGKYKDSIGTHMLFQKGEGDDANYSYVLKTEKELNCKKVVVLPKEMCQKMDTEPS
ncbi:hypothetical protein ACHWQZ_G004845 [Mnemiopsis leidyi]